MREKGEWDELREQHWHMCIVCKIDGYWEAAVQHRELSSVVCDDPEGWDGVVGGRSKREGIYVYIQLIHTVVQQELTQHCRTIIPQLKKKRRLSLTATLIPRNYGMFTGALIRSSQANNTLNCSDSVCSILCFPHHEAKDCNLFPLQSPMYKLSGLHLNVC